MLTLTTNPTTSSRWTILLDGSPAIDPDGDADVVVVLVDETRGDLWPDQQDALEELVAELGHHHPRVAAVGTPDQVRAWWTGPLHRRPAHLPLAAVAGRHVSFPVDDSAGFGDQLAEALQRLADAVDPDDGGDAEVGASE